MSDSSEIAPSSFNVVANDSPAATLPIESSHAISSATAASLANASDDILGHDSQPRFLSAASSSQANASKDENVSQSIAPSAVLSSSQPSVTSVGSPTPSHTIASPPAHPAHDKLIQGGSSSAPSSSRVLTHSDHITNIREASQPTVTSVGSPTPSHTIASPPAHTAHDKPIQGGSSSPPSSSRVLTRSDHITNILEASQPTVTSVGSPTPSPTIASPPADPAHDKRIQGGSSPAPSSSRVLTRSDHVTNIREAVTSVASSTSSYTIASPPAHPAPDKCIQVGSSSVPSSSSVPKDSDHTTNIREAVDAVDIENVDVDLSELINYISELLDFIKEKKKGNKPSKPKAARYHWPGSKSLFKLRDVLSEGINVVKDVCPADTKKIVQGFLQGMGAAHMATTGLLVVANILERYEAISTNKEACLSLLERMNRLARHVTELQKRPELKARMEDSIRKAIELIVEASIACCTQIDDTKFSKFFSTDVNGGKLDNFKTMLTETHTDMQNQMSLCIYGCIERPRKERELLLPQYPKDAVGIEDPLKAIIKRLDWGSDKNALAVIVHGFGGMGKTTLGDAVFAKMFDTNLEGCRYSFLRLLDIGKTPDIKELQKCILRDLKMGEEPEIRRYEEGQQQIEHMLEKEIAFIYIDNALLPDEPEQSRHALEQLLPKDMRNAKKVRLLLTARDKDALKISGVKTEFYPIEILPKPEAVKLLEKTLDDKEKQLNSSQRNQIVEICGGVPKLLTVVAGFINSEENPQKAFRTVMEESKKNWEGDIGEKIKHYVFAYEKLDETLRDPFLDICSFFQGWDWEALSNIVGEPKLKKLEKRALVTKDVKSMTARVHDVILAIGLDKKGERFRFTTASEIKEFLDEKKDEDLKEIKGICSSDNMDPIYIPSSKLDLMYRSLRVLILGDSTEVNGKCKEIFKKLVIFSAGVSRFPFNASKLKKFEMLSHICCKLEDLENLPEMPSNLRHIEFEVKSHAFHISSKCIQPLRDLQVLRLKNAHFKILPQEFGDLVNGLQELTLSNCEYLEKLPGPVSRPEISFIRVLRVKSCSSLKHLPEDFGSLNSLQELDLSGCKSLEELPSSLENLTSLQKLDFTDCKSLKKLPRSLGKLTLLQELRLHACTSLKALPSNLEELSSLRLLDLSRCSIITKLPDGLGKLTSLVNLNLYHCMQLSSIPDSIGQLKLHSINFAFTNLKELPDGFCNLSILTELDMTYCRSLEKLPVRFGELTSLRRLVCCRGLNKLPESFSQLKSLEHLDLSMSKNLEELCIEFKGLSSLRVLLLEDCNMLKKLPEDFHCVTSLEVLDLRRCCKLEGKWMDSMVKMKTLQIVRIGGSTLLEERWGEIRGQCDQSLFSAAVYTTTQRLSDEANILKQLQSKFDSMITNGQEKPIHISDLSVNTLLLVMFDGQQEFSDHFPLSLIEENIDDIQTNLEIVYFGNHFHKLPRKVMNRILGHAPANMDAKALFQKVLSLVRRDSDWRLNSHFQMSAKIVSDEKGDKYLSSWAFFDDEWRVEEFVWEKCGRYLKLKQLIEIPRESNIELLRKLFTGGEEEISLGFLKNDASTKVGVDELEGKTILLDIRPANVCRALPLQSLVDMYVAKERLDFEIITIPIMQAKTNMDVSHKFSKEVPWLVLQTPWQLTNVTKYFLVEGCPRQPRGWDRWYPNKMRVIQSNGTIAASNYPGVLNMVNTWGAEAYPFTAEKRRELIEKEKKQMEDMSDLMFLFKHLESVSEQVKKATRQQKMICLYSCHDEDFTNSIKDVLIELGNIIYIIYMPNFRSSVVPAEFTRGIVQTIATLKPSKMSQGEMQRMLFLSLSEHEAMRFWARIYSLNEEFYYQRHQFRLSKMFSKMDKDPFNYSWIFIMDEDGNVMTTEGKDILKLLCKKYPDERVKELKQELIKGAKESWKKTLLEFEQLLGIDQRC